MILSGIIYPALTAKVAWAAQASDPYSTSQLDATFHGYSHSQAASILSSAVRFRASEHLRADPSFVEQLTRTSGTWVPQLGAPLTQTERRTMDRRLALQHNPFLSDLANLARDFPAAFGGDYLDLATSSVVLQVTASSTARLLETSAAALARRVNVPLEVRHVAVAYAALANALARVTTAADRPTLGGHGFAGAGIVTDRNLIVVMLQDLTQTNETFFRERAGAVPMQFQRSKRTSSVNSPAQGTDGQDSTGQAKGGTLITGLDATDATVLCSQNFVEENSHTQDYYAVTAGHCGSSGGSVWAQGYNVGSPTFVRITWLGAQGTNACCVGSAADAMAIGGGLTQGINGIDPGIASNLIDVYDPLISTGPNEWYLPVTATEGNFQDGRWVPIDVQFQTVCVVGFKTNVPSCGVLLVMDYSSLLGLIHMRFADFNAEDGDSGGPIYEPTSTSVGGSVIAEGVYATHASFQTNSGVTITGESFSQIANVNNALGLDVVTSFRAINFQSPSGAQGCASLSQSDPSTAILVLASCQGPFNPLETFQLEGSVTQPDAYIVRDASTKLCVNPVGGSTAEGANLREDVCNGSLTQQWYVEYDEAEQAPLVNHNWVLQNVGSNRCLEIASDGSTLDQSSCSFAFPATNQVWHFLTAGGQAP